MKTISALTLVNLLILYFISRVYKREAELTGSLPSHEFKFYTREVFWLATLQAVVLSALEFIPHYHMPSFNPWSVYIFVCYLLFTAKAALLTLVVYAIISWLHLRYKLMH